jgi:glycosyltransferase involved in cell wall biosynthesis
VGGVERVFAEVSKELARRGHEVTLLCTTRGKTSSFVEDGVRVKRVHRRLTILRAPVARLDQHLPDDADVVHVAATYPFTTPRVIRRAHTLGVPRVLDFHFEPAPGTPLGRLAARMYGQFGPRSYPLADAVLVRSVRYARASPSLSRVPESRWRVIPNGVDTRLFRPEGAAGKGNYVLFVGRLVPYKGVDVLLHAMARMPSPPSLVLVGDGPMRARWSALAKNLHVRAEFLGHVSDEELAKLYRGARLTVLPSVTRQEAFGMALLESMACGTPVVASSLPGVDEVARLGGLATPPGDAQALATQIVRGLHDADVPRGAALAWRVQHLYSWPAVTDRILEVYQEVTGTRPASTVYSPSVEVTVSASADGHTVL